MGKQDRKVNQSTLPREFRDHAWFVAFAPVGAPEIAIACLLEHAGGGGGLLAAPIVQKVLTAYFSAKNPPGSENDRQTASASH